MKTIVLSALSCGLGMALAAAANLDEATVTRVVKSVEVIPPGSQPKPATVGEIVRGNSDVRTGVMQGSRWQIVEGLRGGDQVIVGSPAGLAPGMPVVPAQAWLEASA